MEVQKVLQYVYTVHNIMKSWNLLYAPWQLYILLLFLALMSLHRPLHIAEALLLCLQLEVTNWRACPQLWHFAQADQIAVC
jgi:hypothetical protein